MDLARSCVHIATMGKDCLSPHIVSDVVTRLARSGVVSRLVSVSYKPLLYFELVLQGGEEKICVGIVSEREGEVWCYAKKGNQAVRFNAVRKARGVVDLVRVEGVEVPVLDFLKMVPWQDSFRVAGKEAKWSSEEWIRILSGGKASVSKWKEEEVPYLSDAAFAEAVSLLLVPK